MKDFDQKVPPLAIFIPSMVWSTQLPIGVRAGVPGAGAEEASAARPFTRGVGGSTGRGAVRTTAEHVAS